MMHHEGHWHSLQHTKDELFLYLGTVQPNITPFDLILPDSSHEYQETWEAARVPLIDSDQFESEESTFDSSETESEEDDTNQQIR